MFMVSGEAILGAESSVNLRALWLHPLLEAYVAPIMRELHWLPIRKLAHCLQTGGDGLQVSAWIGASLSGC